MKRQTLRRVVAVAVSAAMLGGSAITMSTAWADDTDGSSATAATQTQPVTITASDTTTDVTPDTTTDSEAATQTESEAATRSADASGSAADVAGSASASKAGVSSLGVTLGDGVTVYVNETLNQKTVRSVALNHVIKWRKDALNDSRIKIRLGINGVTHQYSVRDYLKQIGMSEQEYLSPKWSNELERIATQRAVEAADYELGHNRPNGTSCFTATYNGYQAFGEILAWGGRDMAYAIDNQWASEKADYINLLNGKPAGQVGHYVQLIQPDVRWYGFGQGTSPDWGTTFAGETSSSLRYNYTQGATNWQGAKTVEVNVAQALLNQGVKSNLGTMNEGTSVQAVAKLRYMSGRYEFRGTWTSTNPSVASVTAGGKVTALRAGTASIRVTDQGRTYSFPVIVKAVPKTVTLAYSGNGATSGSVKTTSGKSGQKVTVAANGFARSGYTFTAWNTRADGRGLSYQPGASIVLPLTNTTLYAQWKKNPAAPTIRSIDPVSVTTTAGTAPKLPNTVTATYTNGARKTVAVTWPYIYSGQYAKAGSFTVNGTVAGTSVKARATVTVKAKPSEPSQPSKPTQPTVKQVPVYRVYNRNSGLHHYTTSAAEKNMLVKLGWRDENRGSSSFITVPKGTAGAKPVYREYNPNSGNHNWTMSLGEHNTLVKLGWRDEGIAWYAPSSGKPVYRLYNPTRYYKPKNGRGNGGGEHVYTMSYGEYVAVQNAGWRGEGIAWKSL
ncbi:Ig-like domain-containing protein [Bifidobacterium simiarum]|uniref:Ig-like domain-containing protein n=1 Tax=Bifidobacterium simiarum TaxID=2045441 RepID=UPI001BDC0B6F|nr:Ig-like domain-containing protein [Bifidobacterium simiarum]MBT1167037.1 Ig-like domain-containing protein [Bifidobacterium simiarum]